MFKSDVSLLIFCVNDLSLAESGCSDVGCIYIHDHYIFLMYGPLYHFIMIFVSCYHFWLNVWFVCYNKAILTFLWFPLAWNVFLHFFNLSPCVPLKLKWISFRQHTVGCVLCVCLFVCFCFINHPATLCFLVGELKPFTFRVIMIHKNLLLPSYWLLSGCFVFLLFLFFLYSCLRLHNLVFFHGDMLCFPFFYVLWIYFRLFSLCLPQSLRKTSLR